MFKLRRGAGSRYRATYLNNLYECDLSFNHDEFYPVDVHYRDLDILIVSGWNTPPSVENITPIPTIQSSFMSLPIALQQTVGSVYFPPDNGVALLSKIKNKSVGIFGASDASLKDDRATHAWIFLSGDIDDTRIRCFISWALAQFMDITLIYHLPGGNCRASLHQPS
jgi:hypothetical protein